MEQLFMIFPERMRKALLRAELSIERLQEIRLRVGRPVLLRYGGTEYGLTKDGHLTDSVDSAGMCPLEEELSQVLEYASDYSVYAFYEEIRQGFFTIAGGHRIGVRESSHGRFRCTGSAAYFFSKCAGVTPDHRLCGTGTAVSSAGWAMPYLNHFSAGLRKNDAAQGPDSYNLQWQQATAWENRRCRGRTLGAGGVLPGCAAE